MYKKLQKIFLYLTMFLIIVGTVMLFLPTMIFSSSVNPIVVPGNPHCADISSGGDQQFKLDPPVAGLYSIGGGDFITVSNFVYDSGNLISFDWSSDKLVFAVIVKGGTDGANVYYYSGGSYGDTVLVTPTEQNISHIVFCYGSGTTTTTDPSTTTTTDPSTTTTTAATTTTTRGTTTTTRGTTTTTQGTTTTTAGTTTTTGGDTTTTTGGTTSTTGGTTSTTGGTTSTTQPTTTTVGAITVLALTGFNSLWYIAGSVLIALGIIMGSFSLSSALKRR